MAVPNIDQNLLQTQAFREAMVAVKRRAEEQTDYQKLIEIFVQSDLPTRCEADEDQIILGRRGTGKTHLIKFFQHEREVRGKTVRYCNCTSLGSGFPSINAEPLVIGGKYFASLLNDIGTFLFDRAVLMESPPSGLQDRVLQHLTDGLARHFAIDQRTGESRFNYRQISDILGSVFRDLGIQHFTLVLDEWAMVPLAAQPYFAEFIKRALLPVPGLSVKVLAVNYQCVFAKNVDGQPIGMQPGADFVDVIDLDSYLVFDEKPDFVQNFFGQLLYNHLGAELGWDLSIGSEQKLKTVKGLFTQEGAFIELVRSAEGNCRDFICIFGGAYFNEFRTSTKSKTISIPNVCAASEAWYINQKESNIRTDQAVQETLSFLFDKVLRGYKSRTFLVERSKAEHPRLLRLLNERILHRLNETYSHPDRPGLRYFIFTLDHGAFVKLRGTKNDPDQYPLFLSLQDAEALPHEERSHVVPFDDKRSIRRIVFDPEQMGLSDGG